MIYLNNAATGFPKPKQVTDAVAAFLAKPPHDPHRGSSVPLGDDPVLACRQRLAEFFGASSPSQIVFTGSATDSLNMALHGLTLNGGHVVTTQIEHNSVLRPLFTLRRDCQVDLSVVQCDSAGTVAADDIAAAMRDDTRAVVVSHSSNVTGVVQDLESIARVARSHGALFVVDASQSAGVVPIDVAALAIDLMAFTGHKGLGALQGIGGLYVRDGIELVPWRIGGTGVRSDHLYQPLEMPMRLEAGTMNLPGIVSLHAGLDFIDQVGLEVMRLRQQQLVGRILDELSEIPEIVWHGNPSRERTMAALNVRGVPPEEAGYILLNCFSIVTRSGLHCAPLIHTAIGSAPRGCLRISPSYFTSDSDIDALLQALREICRMGRGRN